LITISSRGLDHFDSGGSFHVDMEFVRSLRRDDLVYVARTLCAGVGISVIRGETLVAAAGAVTAVPLGRDLVVGVPAVMEAVGALFEQIDPDYQSPEIPLDFGIGGQRFLGHSGTRTLGPYWIQVIRGFCPGMPGTDECAAIARVGCFPETPVSSTAQLLGRGEVERV
jgi:hypothetical protein